MTALWARVVAMLALIALATSSATFAQPATEPGTSMHNGSPAPHVVRVSRCEPRFTTRLVVPPYAGYRPGFYPGGAYYWGDVYGYRYAQPALTSTNGTLYLEYANVTDKVMSTIEFGLIANGRLVAEVRDVGKFSPNVEIKHEFGLSPNVFPLQTGLPQCVPLRIAFADGSHWRNPHLPALRRALYGK